jgi:fatty acid CoA ligase FadD9
MSTDVRSEITNPSGSSDTRAERRARRIAQLYATDPQFRAAEPIAEVIDAARRPGLRLPAILQTFVEGYADRPALGQRARELVLDPATGRTYHAAAAQLRDHQLWRAVVAGARSRRRVALR